MEEMNIKILIDESYINYKSFIFWIKSYYCKFFLFYQLYLFYSQKNFGGDIQFLAEIQINKINLDIA